MFVTGLPSATRTPNTQKSTYRICVCIRDEFASKRVVMHVENSLPKIGKRHTLRFALPHGNNILHLFLCAPIAA